MNKTAQKNIIPVVPDLDWLESLKRVETP